jgi:hypothetical protein
MIPDALWVFGLPVTIMLLAAVYQVIDRWFEARGQCDHVWSRWSDPQKSEGHPYQTRSCNKCNMHEQRLVQ